MQQKVLTVNVKKINVQFLKQFNYGHFFCLFLHLFVKLKGEKVFFENIFLNIAKTTGP